MTKDFQSLIAQAIAAMDKVAAHNDFCTLLEEGMWEYPSTSLIQCRDCLEDLCQTYEKYLEAKNEPINQYQTKKESNV